MSKLSDRSTITVRTDDQNLFQEWNLTV